MSKVITVNGQKVAQCDSFSQSIDVTCDDGGIEYLIPKDLEMSLHFGDKSYTVTITKEEYQRMVDDGVME